MKRIIFLTLAFACNFCVIAQTDLPPAYIITSDTTDDAYLPDSCWQIMGDPSGKMTLQEVINSQHFKNSDKNTVYDINTYWLRYRLTNSLRKELNIWIPVGDAQYVDLYATIDQAQWQHFRSGSFVPWSERDGEKSLISINLTIPPGKSVTVYGRDIFDYRALQIASENVGFVTSQGIMHQQRSHYVLSLQYVFLLGLIFLGIVINLYFFIIVREREFLYFALYLFFVGLSFLSRLGDVFLKDHPVVQAYLTSSSSIVIYFFFIYLVRYFLKTFVHFPGWDKYLVVLSFLQGVILAFAVFGSGIFHKNLSLLSFFISQALVLIISLALLITVLLFIRYKNKSIRLVIYAVAPIAIILAINDILSIVIVTYYLKADFTTVQFFLPVLAVMKVLFSISQAWMIVLFTCLLFMRFSGIRKKMAQQEIEREKERSILIEQQKTEFEKQVTERTAELTQSLENLKSTQKQLIQSEKMASLGELTAGIAHEIQNPLNFVNNFSEVNKEMVDEAAQEMNKGNYDEVKFILNDIKENSEKINHHGKRADSIVKNMLQHSRQTKGVKEPTDINALCDEYLRLSYHGLRAKDKSFNATIETDFDKSIGKIKIVPQDIGRVLLNLFNNAFYACTERSRSAVNERLRQAQPDSNYQPTVLVSTKKIDNKVEIKVKDNGNGIPQNVIDKIFQPFFTTKPTGSGTGLGLSLSYDIIKAHGGEIKVESKEGEGTEFIIQIPLNNSL